MAIAFGFIDKLEARKIMQKFLDKFWEVGFTNFSLGLPGNLIAIKRAVYSHRDLRFGGGIKEDGSDGFQIF